MEPKIGTPNQDSGNNDDDDDGGGGGGEEDKAVDTQTTIN